MGSYSKGHFRWEACEDPRELRRQILGAAIMGLGAILAVGCSVGQGISAFSLLAFSARIEAINYRFCHCRIRGGAANIYAFRLIEHVIRTTPRRMGINLLIKVDVPVT